LAACPQDRARANRPGLSPGRHLTVPAIQGRWIDRS
jgi:hypothetical protein